VAFWFKEIDIPSVRANAVDSSTLWHKRLRHPSKQVLSLLPKSLGVFDNIANKRDHPCDICFRAEQTHNSSNVSESNAKDLFEIVHCDIWGGYSVPSFCGACYFLTIVDNASKGVWVFLMKENVK